MRRLLGLAALVFVGVLAWRVGGMLSTDAIGMAVGMVFGVLAGIPAALLVLASDRHRYADEDDQPPVHRPPYPQLPPVIIVLPAPPAPQPPAAPQRYLPLTVHRHSSQAQD